MCDCKGVVRTTVRVIDTWQGLAWQREKWTVGHSTPTEIVAALRYHDFLSAAQGAGFGAYVEDGGSVFCQRMFLDKLRGTRSMCITWVSGGSVRDKGIGYFFAYTAEARPLRGAGDFQV